MECLFAKASTANVSLSSWSSALFSGSNSSFALKQHTQNSANFSSCPKSGNFNKLKKLSKWYIEPKLHIHTLGISETYFTCKKGHNRSPLRLNVFSFKELNTDAVKWPALSSVMISVVPGLWWNIFIYIFEHSIIKLGNIMLYIRSQKELYCQVCLHIQ